MKQCLLVSNVFILHVSPDGVATSFGGSNSNSNKFLNIRRENPLYHIGHNGKTVNMFIVYQHSTLYSACRLTTKHKMVSVGRFGWIQRAPGMCQLRSTF